MDRPVPEINTTTWVAHAVRRAREGRRWSPADLAERLSKTQTAISYWEAGKRTPGLDDLLSLSEALEVGVDVFLPPERARRPVTAVLRATAERLADSALAAAVDDVATAAEREPLPAAELSIGA